MDILSSPFTGELSSLDGKDDLTGKIVVIPSLLFTSNLPLVRSAQERGAAAVLSTLYYHSKGIVIIIIIIIIIIYYYYLLLLFLLHMTKKKDLN
jgi:hypothetical protein